MSSASWEFSGSRTRGDAPWQGPDVFSTRLHVRYDGAHFPEDLVFQETPGDRSFQGRYVMRHRWTGKSDCREPKEHRKNLPRMLDGAVQSLATLTGWPIAQIRAKMQIPAGGAVRNVRWWEELWKEGRLRDPRSEAARRRP